MRGKDAIRPPVPRRGRPLGDGAQKKVTSPSNVAYNKGRPKSKRKASNVRNYTIYRTPGRHLTLADRQVIARIWNANVLLKRPRSIRAIARELGISEATLRRELKKGGGIHYVMVDGKKKRIISEYFPNKAEEASRLNLHQKGPRQKMTNQIAEAIKNEMDPKGTRSPETVLYNLHKKGITSLPSVCTVYNHIRDASIGFDASWLPRGGKRKHPKKRKETRPAKYSKEGYIIDDIPQHNLSRETFGTWEMDTVVSCKRGKGGALVLIERKTRFYIVRKLRAITQAEVHRQLRKLIRKGTLKTVHTVITDNGCEFLDHKKLCALFRTSVYYTHAYSSWEKGSVENANGLLRNHFPKGTDFAKLSETQLIQAQDAINSIYRRVSLKGKTANEAFSTAA